MDSSPTPSRNASADAPDLSAVVITPRSYDTIRKAVRHLHDQSIRDRIEVVIVAPSEVGLDPDREVLAEFWGWRVVPVGEIDNLGPAEAAGFRAARAPAVVYVEEHSFPAPGWAEALIAAHADRWAAVGPAIENANPESAVSWTTMLLDFGDWVAPGVPGPAASLPSHQTSYKRDVLLPFGNTLGALFETETTLQQTLRAQGHELYFEPAARTRHMNVSRFGEVVGLQFYNYREYAANRAGHLRWGWGRRLLYIGGSPLIPAVRGMRVLRQIRRAGLTRELIPRILPSMAVGLVAAAVGEVAGYALGKGDSSRKRVTFELERLSHVTDSDRRTVASQRPESGIS